MDSYFSFDRLKQVQQKLSQAANVAKEYIPANLINQLPSYSGINDNGNGRNIDIEDDDYEVVVPVNGNFTSSQQKQQHKSEKSEYSAEVEEIKEGFKALQMRNEMIKQEQARREQIQQMKAPKPETAVNEIMKSLLSSKHIEPQASLKIKEQTIMLLESINKPKIDLKEVQILAFKGIPDEVKGLRPILWRIILGHFGRDTSTWHKQMNESHSNYETWKDELIVKPTIKSDEAKAAATKAFIDHPLSVSQNSQWNQFFKDQDLWDEIEKDVKRTRTDMGFFYQALDSSKNVHLDILLRQAECKKTELSALDIKNYIETHSDVLSRILFIYAKLNPGIKYVQGMNEVLAVLYYCFWNFGDESVISNKYLESDLFFCFTNLMTEIRDGFLRELDHEHSGISGKVRKFANILAIVDPLVFRNLEDQGMNHQFYSLRWLMLLMCQEFDMSNVIRLWDTLLSDQERFEFLNYVCVATVQTRRKEIMHGDFAECMEALQKAPENIQDVRVLISDASNVYQRFIRKLRQQESQWENEGDNEEENNQYLGNHQYLNL